MATATATVVVLGGDVGWELALWYRLGGHAGWALVRWLLVAAPVILGMSHGLVVKITLSLDPVAGLLWVVVILRREGSLFNRLLISSKTMKRRGIQGRKGRRQRSETRGELPYCLQINLLVPVWCMLDK
jgi:hypothetical protein